jgi:hypothetical protein
MFHRPPVNSHRSHSNTCITTTPNNPTGNGIPRHRKRHNTFPITATLNTWKYTQSRRPSTTAQPPYVSSTSGRKQIDATETLNTLSTPNNSDRKYYSPSPQASQHFSVTAYAKHRKYTQSRRNFHDRSATVCPIDFRSTTIDAR